MDGQNFYNDQNENTNKADALAIISLIAGILSIVICCTTYYSLIPGIIGLVCSIISKKQNGKTGIATAGFVCSIIGCILAVLWTLFVLVVGTAGLAMLENSGIDFNSFY